MTLIVMCPQSSMTKRLRVLFHHNLDIIVICCFLTGDLQSASLSAYCMTTQRRCQPIIAYFNALSKSYSYWSLVRYCCLLLFNDNERAETLEDECFLMRVYTETIAPLQLRVATK